MLLKWLYFIVLFNFQKNFKQDLCVLANNVCILSSLCHYWNDSKVSTLNCLSLKSLGNESPLEVITPTKLKTAKSRSGQLPILNIRWTSRSTQLGASPAWVISITFSNWYFKSLLKNNQLLSLFNLPAWEIEEVGSCLPECRLHWNITQIAVLVISFMTVD